MHDILFQYLILNKKIALPGIGGLYILRKPAVHRIAEKSFAPPVYQVAFDHTDDKPSKKLFTWIAAVREITEWDAVRSVNDFAFDLRRELSSKGEAAWRPAGVFKRDDRGEITFESAGLTMEGEEEVPGDKVIRKEAEHRMIVGETERSSVEMEEILSAGSAKKDRGWVVAVILVMLLVMFIGWYFSERGVRPRVTGNKAAIHTE